MAPVTLATGAATASSLAADQCGFTLVELMLTVAIATILSMSVPMTATAIPSARRNGYVWHAVSARAARPICRTGARRHRPNSRLEVRHGNGAMERAVEERRGEPRLAATALEIERATLRPGCLVAVLDLSATGAQVQSERPLRPGSRIHVRIAARHWTVAVAADVVRCSVWILQADVVIYRGALRFEEACTAFWEEQTRLGDPLAIARP